MRTTSPVRVILWIALALTVIWGAQVVVTSPAGAEPAEAVAAPDAEAQAIHDLRVRKCERLWQTFAPWSYSEDLVDFFVTEHERRGIADQWYYSFLYGMANFGLRAGATAPGHCYGPMDCKWPYAARADAAHVLEGAWGESALRQPRVNIACHVGEMARHHESTEREGMALLRTVFYPAAPWGRATNRWAPQWSKWDRRCRACIERGYAVGKLPGDAK